MAHLRIRSETACSAIVDFEKAEFCFQSPNILPLGLTKVEDLSLRLECPPRFYVIVL